MSLPFGAKGRAEKGALWAPEGGQRKRKPPVIEGGNSRFRSQRRDRFITDCAREMGQSRRCFACNQLFLCHEPIRLGGLFKQGSEFTVYGLKLIPGGYRFPFLRFGIGFSVQGAL